MKKTAVGLCVIGCLAGTMARGVPDTAKWITVFSQNFDGFTPTSGQDWYGNAATTAALWGPLDPDKNDRLSTNRAYSGTQSLRLDSVDVAWPSDCFGAITEKAHVGSGTGRAKQFELSYKLYYETASGLVATHQLGWWTHNGVSGGVPSIPTTGLSHTTIGGVRLESDTRARMKVMRGSGGSAYFNDPVNWENVVFWNNWRGLRFVYDLTAGAYGRVHGYVANTPGGTEKYMGYVDFVAPFLAGPNMFTFWPPSNAGLRAYLDDIKLTIPPPTGTIMVIR